MKGISTIIATILLVVITIGLVSTAYLFVGGLLTGQISKTINLIDAKSHRVVIQNMGTKTISSDEIKVLVNGREVEITNPQTIEPKKTATLKFIPPKFGSAKIDIIGPSNTISYKQDLDVAVYKSENECEYFDWGAYKRFSRDLYVLENSKIKFFSGVPRVYNTTDGTCTGPVEVYDDAHGASPMRIWAKNTDSSTYRENERIIDQTHFRAIGITTFSFSDPNSISVSVDSESLTLSYKGGIASNLEPTVNYTIFSEENYVKVQFSVKNVGGSNINVRLKWDGDQDPPAINWRNGDGKACGGCHANAGVGNVSNWTAGIPCGYNDVYGIMIKPTEYLFIHNESALNPNNECGGWASVRLEEISPTTLAPGQSHTLKFWLVSDAKGPTGEEWKPVEDAYNEIFG